MLDIDVRALVDETAIKWPPALKPILTAFADELIAKLKEAMVGRKITFTINIE